MVDERRGEAVALVDELLEDRLPLARETRSARQPRPRARRRERLSSVSSRRATILLGRWAPRRGNGTRSCPATLSDRSTTRCGRASPRCRTSAGRLRRSRRSFGLRMPRRERTSARGSSGPRGGGTRPARAPHALDGARPRPPHERLRRERACWTRGERLRELGLTPTLFCGGGWYTDVEVAEACAELGYVDCTLRARRPPYLPAGERWASLAAPAVVELPSGRMLGAMPTTHSLGDLARALARRELPPVVHVYFHDTDLLDRRRRTLLSVVLRLLARRARRLRPRHAQLPGCCRTPLASRGTTWLGSNIHGMSGKVAPPAEMSRPATQAADERSRRSRLTPLRALARADPLRRTPRSFGRGARRPGRRRARARDLPRARPPAGRHRRRRRPLEPALARGPG